MRTFPPKKVGCRHETLTAFEVNFWPYSAAKIIGHERAVEMEEAALALYKKVMKPAEHKIAG